VYVELGWLYNLLCYFRNTHNPMNREIMVIHQNPRGPVGLQANPSSGCTSQHSHLNYSKDSSVLLLESRDTLCAWSVSIRTNDGQNSSSFGKFGQSEQQNLKIQIFPKSEILATMDNVRMDAIFALITLYRHLLTK
jgi:hypothetical protein